MKPETMKRCEESQYRLGRALLTGKGWDTPEECRELMADCDAWKELFGLAFLDAVAKRRNGERADVKPKENGDADPPV